VTLAASSLVVAAAVPATGGAAAKKPITIDIITDLTGPYAGQAGPTPALAYIKRVNAKGGVDGRRITVHTYDGQSNAAATLAAARRAIQDKPAGIVLQAFLSTSAVAALGPTGIPVVGFGAFPGWTGHANVFSVVGDITTHNSDAWLRVLTKLGRTKLALAGVSEPDLNLLRKLAPAAGAKIVYFNPGLGISVDAPTALSVAQAIKAAGADGLVVLGVGGPAIQANLTQLNADVIVEEPSEFGPAVVKQYGDKVDGMIFSGAFAQVYTTKNKGIAQFKSDMTRFGYAKNIYLPSAPPIYASTQMLLDALAKVGAPFANKRTVAQLNRTRNFTAGGIIPRATFPKWHTIGTDCLSSSVVRNGKWAGLQSGSFPFTCSKSGDINTQTGKKDG
jgi:ABC-type branched-subunit amino acid transport system substrate-binding protein